MKKQKTYVKTLEKSSKIRTEKISCKHLKTSNRKKISSKPQKVVVQIHHNNRGNFVKTRIQLKGLTVLKESSKIFSKTAACRSEGFDNRKMPIIPWKRWPVFPELSEVKNPEIAVISFCPRLCLLTWQFPPDRSEQNATEKEQKCQVNCWEFCILISEWST